MSQRCVTVSYIYRRGAIYWFRLRVPQGQIRCSLHTSNREIAKVLAAERMVAIRSKILELEKYRTSETVNTTTTPINDDPPIGSVIEKYCAEKVQSGSWTAKSEAENRSIYQLFFYIIGDIRISNINHSTVRRYKEILQKLPPNLTKKYPKLSVSEVLKLNPPPMSITTINKHLNRMSSLFDWMCRHGYVDKNYFSKLGLKKEKRDSDLRDPFTSADLRLLFPTKHGKHSYYYWLPWLGLFTGARLNELCQLHTADIKQQDGIWFIDINDNTPDKRLKNKASKRVIPIHPRLEEKGFIGFVQDPVRDRVFPELILQRDGYGQAASKWFSRYKRRVGIVSEKKAFHSFRHTVAHELKNQGCSEHEIAAIMGHTTGSLSMEHYGKRYRLQRLKEVIEKLQFEID